MSRTPCKGFQEIVVKLARDIEISIYVPMPVDPGRLVQIVEWLDSFPEDPE